MLIEREFVPREKQHRKIKTPKKTKKKYVKKENALKFPSKKGFS